MRVFLAHKKGVPEDELLALRDRIQSTLKMELPDDVTVVTGMQDFTDNIANDGSFGAWAKNVIARRDSFTGQRVYDAVFVMGYRLGKATAQIVGMAFNQNVPVVVCDTLDCGSIEFKRASQLIVEDAEDYTDGWWLDTH